jgi:hypothetical protein
MKQDFINRKIFVWLFLNMKPVTNNKIPRTKLRGILSHNDLRAFVPGAELLSLRALRSIVFYHGRISLSFSEYAPHRFKIIGVVYDDIIKEPKIITDDGFHI